MGNPYEILGVPENASMDEVKRAYKELVKKYHPDKYANNPLADLASEKLKEINEAYDAITKSGGHYQSGGDYSSGGSGAADFNTVRAYINANNLAAAEQLLNSISDRGGEWNYLMGVIHMRKGWYDSARGYFNTACSLEPNNLEYRNAVNSMNNQSTMYRNMNSNVGNNDFCNCCAQLYIADCCCECLGGDLINCC